MAENRWLPLESNPDVMNKYIHKLGAPEDSYFLDVYDLEHEGLKQVPRPILAVLLLLPLNQYIKALGVSDCWQFVDVWGFEPELLAVVPHPVAAVLLLYPITEKSEKELIGQIDPNADIYFIKQTIGNACGTIGLIHALCNNAEKLGFDTEKHLSKFFSDTKGLSPEERGKHLESDTAFGEAHDESAQEGQTQAPPREDKLDLHFVAFIHHKGKLYELDGRKDGPILHGNTTEDTLLEDSAEIVKKFMARDPDSLKFTVIALVKPE